MPSKTPRFKAEVYMKFLQSGCVENLRFEKGEIILSLSSNFIPLLKGSFYEVLDEAIIKTHFEKKL
jgi:hypothetical protein